MYSLKVYRPCFFFVGYVSDYSLVIYSMPIYMYHKHARTLALYVPLSHSFVLDRSQISLAFLAIVHCRRQIITMYIVLYKRGGLNCICIDCYNVIVLSIKSASASAYTSFCNWLIRSRSSMLLACFCFLNTQFITLHLSILPGSQSKLVWEWEI